MARSVLSYVLVTLAALVLLKLLVTFLEPRMAFFPFTGVQASPTDLGIPYEPITVDTADGETIAAWFLRHPDPRAEIIFWHGNGGNLSLWLEVLVGMYRQGLSVLAFDYRGYGESSGAPSEQGIYRDTDAVVRRFMTSLHEPDATIVYWGRSLGSVVAAYATTIQRPDGLILESTFPSVASLLSRDPIMKLLSLFSSYRFPTEKFLRGFDRPVLVVHGDSDGIIPIEEGRKLFETLDTDKRFVTVSGADHNDFHPLDETLYWGPVMEFVDKVDRARAGHPSQPRPQ